MDRRYITILIIFGFAMVLVGQVKIMLERMEEPSGDPLIEAIDEHLSKEDSITSGITSKLGGNGSFFNRSTKPDDNIIAPSQGAPEGYRRIEPNKPEMARPIEKEPAALPSLDNEPSASAPQGYKPAPSYYPTPGGR